MAKRIGGVGDAKPATPEVQQFVTDLHPEVQGKAPELKDSKAGEAISFATQVVAGTNYFVKAKYVVKNATTYAHLRIFKGLPVHAAQGPPVQPAPTLNSIQYPKKEDDPITYF